MSLFWSDPSDPDSDPYYDSYSELSSLSSSVTNVSRFISSSPSNNGFWSSFGLFCLVYFTSNILIPPARQTNPPKNTPFIPISPAPVTKNGAPILPKFDIASETPVPVDLISVGNDYVVINEKRAKPKVLKSRLNPKNMISMIEPVGVNCINTPKIPAEHMNIKIHRFLYIFSQ